MENSIYERVTEKIIESLKKGVSSEELIAELGSAFLCAEAQIDSADLLENSASYIANWLEKLENDKKLIIFAASKAQKASNMILNRLPKKEVEK